jgi:serine/threonine-protein kinase
MGAVLKGRDTDLGRDIAIKILLDTHQGRTELVRRFVEEAQISGQLQHPGVVPIYELGQFLDRRPYFTMKLVKGRTLAALLAARPEPAHDRSRFLKVFEQVCQTLAYAHARGVIHRDLKPSNIMVGAFGEVQVMDWGLAKVLKPAGDAGGCQPQQPQTVSVIQTQRRAETAEAGVQTQAGSVLGTPAYMAPEQARGDVDLVDARADVFGLGAILCEVLTGRPAFTGEKAEATRKAQTAQLADTWRRLDQCGADSELIGLARHCLAAEPWERPRDACEVAAAVTTYQNAVAERLRQAELAQAAGAARAEEAQATAAQERKARQEAQARATAERRARRVTLGLAASVVALVTVGAACGLWMQRQRAVHAAEARQQREAVETALDNARDLGRQGRRAEARAVLEQTRDRLGQAGPEDLRRRVEQGAADLALVDRLEAIRLKRSEIVEGQFDNRGTERDYVAAFRDAGLGKVDEDTETVAARIRGSAVREQLVAALDHWTTVTDDPRRAAWLLAVARRADPDPWRDRFRDPDVWRDPARLAALAKELLDDEKQLTRQGPQLLAALGGDLSSARADALPLLAAAQARYPDDFWLNFELGYALDRAKRWDEAVGFYRAAIAIRPTAAAVHTDLASALRSQKRLGAAIQELRRAIDLDPNAALPHNNLGNALFETKQVDAAIQELRRAVALQPNYAVAHCNLGTALDGKRQLEAATLEFRKAIALQPDYVEAHCKLGLVLRDLGQLAESLEELRKGDALGSKQPDWRFPSALWVRQGEHLLAVGGKLSAVLEGKDKPANDAERLILARLCLCPSEKRYAASYHFYATAFAHDRKLAEDMPSMNRYNAACAAALAGCGQGQDAGRLDENERARLRTQAAAWLRADLAHWTRQVESANSTGHALVEEHLRRWQHDTDLAGIRREEALKKLPPGERQACQRLWADVAELLRKVQENTK